MAPKASFGHFLTQLNRYLEGKYGTETGSHRDTLSASELKLQLTDKELELGIVQYLIGMIDDDISEATELFISKHPIEFVSALSEFIYEFRLDKNNEKQNTKIKEQFFDLVIEDLRTRPESGLLNTQQLHWLANAASRFSEDKDKKQSFEARMKTEEIRVLAESTSSRVLMEHFHKQEDGTSNNNYLFGLGNFIQYSKHLVSFSGLTLEQLISVLEDLREIEKSQITARASVGEKEMLSERIISSQLEEAILPKLDLIESASNDKSNVQRLKTLYRGVGAKPDSVSQKLLHILSRENPDEGLDSYWWEPLSLRDLLRVIKQSPNLGNALVASAKKGTWFTKTLDRHVSESGSLEDLAIGLEATDIFGSPTARELLKIWMSVATRSPVLHEIQQSMVETPVNNMKLLGEKHLAEAAIVHQSKIESLNDEIAILNAAISTLEATMQRGKDNLGDTKAGLETGISRKYGDAIARIIRRMEREAGKNSFQDIITKESAGLSRLGISLLVSGSTQPFDPAIHDSIGQNIELGANVTIIETGVLLLLGKDTITLLKAVVRPAE